ncbi:hypothetical protein H6G41_14650 [Tolypothrix sp. FACHB-123]|uniref:hypothetical protein n=1 Tax=Tolypothrix sp. FACHB-123 TaxID=2692868 RepID=UPI00168443D7|nr:hypothetical protein [Tolypothrix sp. FACHB-123]MBD2355841.1 hypothetical protein [Tolypothrix sp. FACHB-123]
MGISVVIAGAIGKAIASKVATIAINKILAIEVQERGLGQWGEQIVLGIFFGEGLVPDLSFEKQTELRFAELDRRIDQVNRDLEKLRNELQKFKWSVNTKFYEEREEDLWKDILDYEEKVQFFYPKISQLGRDIKKNGTSANLDQIKQKAREIAQKILDSDVPVNINLTCTRLLGKEVGVEAEKVRGFLEIWTNLAIEEVNERGWQDGQLLRIYEAIEKKFMQVLLRQLQGMRLLMEAYSVPDVLGTYENGLEYFVKEAYPMLAKEIEAFQRSIEAIAINVLPLPDAPLSTLEIPADIAIMLGCADYFCGEILSGRKLASDPSLPLDPTLTTLPVLAGCWGRAIIPGRRWIGRKGGSQEPARLKLIDGQQTFYCNGVLTVKTTKFLPNNDRPNGYLLYIGTEPRAMNELLIAHFVPTDILPASLVGREIEVQLEDLQGDLLASTQVVMCQVESESMVVPQTVFGSFTIAFTGGAEIRKR